ncbi:hypothetical protein [Streptomyces sp. NPDC056227]|uniref:hypothetical protein n=1 Tax=Streptomyces sp. NPDC056227 TaxID=3345753 RepID=UPI0035D89B49
MKARRTALELAVWAGEAETIRLLLAAGADSHQQTDEYDELTPLCQAAMRGHMAVQGPPGPDSEAGLEVGHGDSPATARPPARCRQPDDRQPPLSQWRQQPHHRHAPTNARPPARTSASPDKATIEVGCHPRIVGEA